ncbi:MAG TPA: class I tRNA ligase family protein [Ignavibacteriales bacterium]|nr:class I tRNA ligase family protein [Ignavibacteriales bacterium]
MLSSAKAPSIFNIDTLKPEEQAVYRKINQTLVKFDSEINNFRFNTAIASLMELINELGKNLSACSQELKAYTLERFALMLAPVAPHLADECWNMIGGTGSLFENPRWFAADEKALIESSVSIAVQVSGKLRATIEFPMDSDEATVKSGAKSDPRVSKHIEGKTVVKEIFVKNKILNIVVK